MAHRRRQTYFVADHVTDTVGLAEPHRPDNKFRYRRLFSRLADRIAQVPIYPISLRFLLDRLISQDGPSTQASREEVSLSGTRRPALTHLPL
jgi:hypothetical protein